MIILSIVLVLFGLYLTHRSTKILLNPVSFTVLFWLCAYIGGIELYIKYGHILTPLYIAVGMFSFSIGVTFSKIMRGFSPNREINAWRSKTADYNFEGRTAAAILTLSILTLFSTGTLYYWLSTSGIQFFNPDARIFLRTGTGFYIRILENGLPLLAGTCYSIWRLKKGRKLRPFLYFFLLITVVILIAQLWWTARSGFLFYLVYIILCESFIAIKKRKSHIYISGILLVSIGLLVAFFLNLITGRAEAGDLIIRRIFTGQAEGLDYIIYIWKPSGAFSGSSIISTDINNFFAFLRLSSYKPSLGFLLYDNAYNISATYNYVTIFLGDLYASLNILGLIAGSLLLGFILQILFIWTIRGSKNGISIAFKILTMKHFAYLAIGGGLFGYCMTNVITTVLFLLILVLTYYFFSLPMGSVNLKIKKILL